MPIDTDIKLDGLDSVMKRLQQLDPKQMDTTVLKGVRAGNLVFQSAMIENAPEQAIETPSGNSLPKGLLKADIGVRTKRETDGTIVGTIGPGKLTSHVARWVEYGHIITPTKKSKGKRPSKGTGKLTTPNPFIRRTFDQTAPEALKAVEETIVSELKKSKVL